MKTEHMKTEQARMIYLGYEREGKVQQNTKAFLSFWSTLDSKQEPGEHKLCILSPFSLLGIQAQIYSYLKNTEEKQRQALEWLASFAPPLTQWICPFWTQGKLSYVFVEQGKVTYPQAKAGGTDVFIFSSLGKTFHLFVQGILEETPPLEKADFSSDGGTESIWILFGNTPALYGNRLNKKQDSHTLQYLADWRQQIIDKWHISSQEEVVLLNAWGISKEQVYLPFLILQDAKIPLGQPYLMQKDFLQQSPFFPLSQDGFAQIDYLSLFAEKLSLDFGQDIRFLFETLRYGIWILFHLNSFQKALVAVSGGIDSAVIFSLAALALGKENVLALSLPGPYSSEHSKKDAKDLADGFSAALQTFSIQETFHQLQEHWQSLEGDMSSLAQENLQARIRGLVGMMYSNHYGYLLLNTCNKSEDMVGYNTLYGDAVGAIAPLGDVFKTDVFALGRYIQKAYPDIHFPESILTKDPSAELAPNQKDEDSLLPYHQLDFILDDFLHGKLSQDPEIQKIYEKVLQSLFKRRQAPPVWRVSSDSEWEKIENHLSTFSHWEKE